MCVILTTCVYLFAAPEVLTSSRYDAKAADIWSAGVMLYTMLCCSYPFEKKEDDPNDLRTQTKIMQRIMKGRVCCPAHCDVLYHSVRQYNEGTISWRNQPKRPLLLSFQARGTLPKISAGSQNETRVTQD